MTSISWTYPPRHHSSLSSLPSVCKWTHLGFSRQAIRCTDRSGHGIGRTAQSIPFNTLGEPHCRGCLTTDPAVYILWTTRCKVDRYMSRSYTISEFGTLCTQCIITICSLKGEGICHYMGSDCRPATKALWVVAVVSSSDRLRNMPGCWAPHINKKLGVGFSNNALLFCKLL